MTVAYGISDTQLELMSLDDDDRTTMVGLAQAAGITDWRIQASWAKCMPSPTSFNWTAVDQQITALQSVGITPVIVLGVVAPRWITNASGGVTTASADQFAAFCTEVVARYGNLVYEVWSDPNAGRAWGGIVSASDYIAYLQAAYSAIKAVQPSATVIFGSLQHLTTGDNTYTGWWSLAAATFLTNAYAAGAHGYFDALGFKPFTDVDGVIAPDDSTAAVAESDALHSIMTANGDGSKPIWWTFGYSTADYTPAQQLAGVEAMFGLAGTRSEVTRLFVQSLRDSLSDPYNHDGNYGIITQDFTPKPLYYWIQLLNPYYRTGTLAGSGDFTATAEGLVIGGTVEGAGTFTGSATVIVAVSGSIAGTGAFSGSGIERYPVTGTVEGTGTFTGFEGSGQFGNMTGSGGFTATGIERYTAAGTMTGAGALSGTALVRRPASGTIAGTGAFTSAVTTVMTRSQTLSGSGKFSATGIPHSPPTIVGAGATTAISSASPTADASGISGWTPAAGDLILYTWNSNSQAATIAVPTDWFNVLGGTTIAASATNSGGMIGHLVTTAEATAGTKTWTLTGLFTANNGGRAFTVVVRGANSTTPINTAAYNTGPSPTTATMTIPDITPTVSGGIVIGAAGPDDTNRTLSDFASPWTTLAKRQQNTSTCLIVGAGSGGTIAGTLFSGTTSTLNGSDESFGIAVVIAPA